MLGKKSSQKSAKTRFFYSQEFRDQKMGEKKRGTIFPRNTRIVPAKNVGKKIVTKKCENTFLYTHEFRDQKMGEKSAEQFFHKHTNSVRKNVGKKIVSKQCENTFFCIHTNIVTKKWGGKNA